jgi:polysaccharide pyruvyl transferase WcaK-like protein
VHEVRFAENVEATESVMSLRIAIFGAAPDSSNMGVSALLASTVATVSRLDPGFSFAVFDNALGVRRSDVYVGEGRSVAVDRLGARGGMRFDLPENLFNMSVNSRLGTFGRITNRVIREIDRCSAVLDVSGGDSFSDIYGSNRFYTIARPKLIALRRRVPLILLPQTYGPFQDPRSREVASRIVRGAEMCWARDPQSFNVLRDLLGDAFDPENHRQGVDLAFQLEPQNATGLISPKLLRMLEADRQKTPLIGLNVSGLIYNRPDAARAQFGIRADYRAAVGAFLQRVLEDTVANVVLVPHVMTLVCMDESDTAASEQVAQSLKASYAERVAISPHSLDQHQLKWLIGQTDWFAGTRMHSTIASLSSGVPTATITYSDKALGVFGLCGQQDQVIDPRRLDTEQVVAKLRSSFESRDATRHSLRQHLPSVRQRAQEQMAEIVSRVRCSAA